MIPKTLPPCALEAIGGLACMALSLSILAAPLSAQTSSAQDSLVYLIDPVVVTATRGPRELSRIPQPMSVVQLRELQQINANTVTDLFRGLPGLDVTGVGVSQGRPQIRGLKGQRILLLADGLRLNNSRRQQDFGELPALVDVAGVERVEVVRGPSSVLYGSDAIGGVINVITRAPQKDGVHGNARVRYGNVEEQWAGTARTFARFGDFSIRAGGTVRQAQPYFAPKGEYGDIVLAQDAQVDFTGTKDQMFDFRLGYETGTHSVFGKYERYDAEDSGFGSLNPALYAPSETEVRITYPTQTFNKISAGYRAAELGAALADQVEILAYGQDNDRELLFGIGPFPIGPTATMELANLNTTDIRSQGGRAEVRKLVVPATLLTYGVDMWRDRAAGTDANTTTMIGFGPTPIESTDNTPALPEATYLSVGAFLQGEVEVSDRLSLVAGGRWQHVRAETFETVGLESQTPVDITDGTFVWALNSVFEVSESMSLVGTVGKAFRSPNLTERFFDGPTPEGSGYQVRNPELSPETSINFDLGVRIRQGRIGLEAFAFQNEISDGIRIESLGVEVEGLLAHQMVNVDQLRFRGLELGFDADLGSGLTFLTGFTKMDTEDVNDIDKGVGESFSTKTTGQLRYEHPTGRFWTAGEVRHNGDQKDTGFVSNPVGDVMPAFTVLNLRGGVTVFRSDSGVEHRLNIAVTNLTNTLYAEFANVGFFRPEPKRNLTVTWDVSF